MKSLNLGDLHLGINEQDEHFLSYQKKCLEWIIEQVNRDDINKVNLLGDVFDNRKALSHKSIELAQWFISQIKHKLNVLVIGNHDTHYKNNNQPNSLSLLFPEHLIAEDVVKFQKTIFVSWVNETNKDLIVENIKNSEADYLFGHFDFSGFKMIKGINSKTDSIDKELVSKFKYVLTGHYHNYSEKGNIVYIGSPYEMNFGDEGEDKFVVVLDEDKGELEFIKNPYQYHHKIYFNSDEDLLTEDKINELSVHKIKLFINCEQTIKMNKVISTMQEKIKNLDITDNHMVQLTNGVEIEIKNESILEIWNQYLESEDIEDKEEINDIFEEEYRKVI